MRQVAIIDLSPSSCMKAPFGDPEWELWGLPFDPFFVHYHRGFEMHDRALWEKRGEPYLVRLQEADVPIYMRERQPDVPASRPYPLTEVRASVGDYFASSIAYMLALAIYEKVDRVGLWGVELAEGTEYEKQRPNLEYLIGMGRGMGLEIEVAEPTTIFAYDGNENFLGQPVRYPRQYGCLQ